MYKTQEKLYKSIYFLSIDNLYNINNTLSILFSSEDLIKQKNIDKRNLDNKKNELTNLEKDDNTVLNSLSNCYDEKIDFLGKKKLELKNLSNENNSKIKDIDNETINNENLNKNIILQMENLTIENKKIFINVILFILKLFF